MTGQIPDLIALDGPTNVKKELFSNPLEVYYQQHPPRPEFQMQNTANWRGYIATWEISENKFYLTQIEGMIKGGQPCSVEFLFPNQSGKVWANWFSGVLRIVDGKCLKYIHMGYQSVYEREILITIEKGNVVKQEIKDNTKHKFHNPFSRATPPPPPNLK
jgi:hypothetical protein